ncbi:MAG: hypothetical protein ACLQGP_26655 [Isosphaeraceae bacterium]
MGPTSPRKWYPRKPSLTLGKTQKLTDRPMCPNDALRMIKRRAKAVGLISDY